MLIVGAGPTGLTLAYELGRRGLGVCVIERADRVGGLGKSFDYDGRIFDIGPKRFHTEDPKVLNFINHVLGEEKLLIGRSTKVFFAERFFEWPLSSKELLKLPMGLSLKCLRDLVKQRQFTDKASFENYVRFKYGTSLYEIFFKPYTEKFLRIPADKIHADWATTGINRSIIDKNAKGNSLTELLQGLLLPAKVDTQFIYPASGGFGGFWSKLAEMCIATGNVTFKLKTSIKSLHREDEALGVITDDDKVTKTKKLCWSGNLNDLIALVGQQGEAAPSLQYINTIFYNLVVDASKVSKHQTQWIYVSDGSRLISRITYMRAFAPYTCVSGEQNLICEVTDSQSAPRYFQDPNRFCDRVVSELVGMGLLSNSQAVKNIYLNLQRDTYPVYHRNYLHDFGAARRIVAAFSRNILLLGRSGAFWYNNSDHSIRMALDTAKNLTEGRDQIFDHRAYFGGIQSAA
jgi:protoporphyrinogen oxidase